MKKVIFLIAVLLLSVIYFGCEQQIVQPEQNTNFSGIRFEKMNYDLFIDGVTDPVGEVVVWSDADYLYVGYSVDAPYCITSTQVKIASSVEGLLEAVALPHTQPQTCSSTDYYEVELITLGIAVCQNIFVTATAVLEDPTACDETSFSFGSGTTTVTNVIERRSGNQSSFTQLNQPAPAGLAWIPNAWQTHNQVPFLNNAKWIWETTEDQTTINGITYNYIYPSDPVVGTVLKMKMEFEICGTPDSDAKLYITCDNGYEVWINSADPEDGSLAGHVGQAQVQDFNGILWQNSTLIEDFCTAHDWESFETYDLTNLHQGINTMYLHVANENAPGETKEFNPAGVIFLIAGTQTPRPSNVTASAKSGPETYYVPYTLPCPDNCQDETGYAGGTQGNGSAWWYYFDKVGTQPIYAGQNQIMDASVTYENPVPPSTTGTLIINLGPDWELMYVNEPVKVTELVSIPSKRPVPGKAQYKTYTYDVNGNIVVRVNPANYYAIHLDLMNCP
jgi:hypothetical protein